ncbi:hypothetical protein DSECCO2_538730 [anaerobic digester metagenome]
MSPFPSRTTCSITGLISVLLEIEVPGPVPGTDDSVFVAVLAVLVRVMLMSPWSPGISTGGFTRASSTITEGWSAPAGTAPATAMNRSRRMRKDRESTTLPRRTATDFAAHRSTLSLSERPDG